MMLCARRAAAYAANANYGFQAVGRSRLRTEGGSAMSSRLALLLSLLLSVACGPGLAEKKYGPGVTDTEIKIGQTYPYSGPLSAYSTIAKTQLAFFEKINAEGGVNGRKIRLISLDDAFTPPKTVEQTRKLVEAEEVLLLFQSLGTPTVSSILKYVNAKKVPTIFIASGATKWGDPRNSPWTIGWQPTYHLEMGIFARYIMKQTPGAKVGVLFLNNDAGKDFLDGVRLGFGDQYRKFVVSEIAVEATDPTIDSQIVSMKGTGVDVVINTLPPKSAAQAIRKIYDLSWKPAHYLSSISSSVASVLQPAGLERSVGIVSLGYVKDPSDPQWSGDPGVAEYKSFMKKHYAMGDPNDGFNVYGYSTAQTLVHVLKQCGDDLTRENVMRQVTSIQDLELPLLLPGIKVHTSPTDVFPIRKMQMIRFDGTRWVRFGDVLGE
jgi:branched-chain amino acid transport system substrate-binding protein